MAIQPCDAFQSRLGRKTRTATAPPSQGQGVRSSSRRSRSRSTRSRSAGASSAAVYLERSARPTTHARRDPPPPPRAGHEPGGAGIGRLHRRVGQRHASREHEHGGGGGEDRGQGRDAWVVGELPGDEPGEDHRQRAAGHEEEPHARLAGEDRGGRPDEPRDHGRVIEVAQVQPARPHPVVGLVGVEVEPAEEQEAEDRHTQRDGPDGAHPAASTSHGRASYMGDAALAPCPEGRNAIGIGFPFQRMGCTRDVPGSGREARPRLRRGHGDPRSRVSTSRPRISGARRGRTISSRSPAPTSSRPFTAGTSPPDATWWRPTPSEARA